MAADEDEMHAFAGYKYAIIGLNVVMLIMTFYFLYIEIIQFNDASSIGDYFYDGHN